MNAIGIDPIVSEDHGCDEVGCNVDENGCFDVFDSNLELYLSDDV